MKRMLVHGCTSVSVRWTMSVIPVPPTRNAATRSDLTQALRATRNTAPEKAATLRPMMRHSERLYVVPVGSASTRPIRAAP